MRKGCMIPSSTTVVRNMVIQESKSTNVSTLWVVQKWRISRSNMVKFVGTGGAGDRDRDGGGRALLLVLLEGVDDVGLGDANID
jgi:ABC-type methionine transport system permease subunit